MHTIEQIASQIETIKPNLTDFLECLNKDEQSTIMKIIGDEQNIFVKLLMCEIALTQYQTHNHRYLNHADSNKIEQMLKSYVNYQIPLGNWQPYKIPYNTNKFKDTIHVLAHLSDTKPYLSNYLKTKTRDKKVELGIKDIKPDLFALKAFQKYVESLPKGIQSNQVIEYLNKLDNTYSKELKLQYIEVLMDNCKKPSIKLQKNLAESYQLNKLTSLASSDVSLSKYMSFSRYYIRNLAHTYNIDVTYHTYDERDSEFKPFVTNVPRTPTTSEREFNALFDALKVLNYVNKIEPKEQLKFMIEQLEQHLSLPDYAELIKNKINYLEQSFKLNSEVINKFSKES